MLTETTVTLCSTIFFFLSEKWEWDFVVSGKIRFIKERMCAHYKVTTSGSLFCTQYSLYLLNFANASCPNSIAFLLLFFSACDSTRLPYFISTHSKILMEYWDPSVRIYVCMYVSSFDLLTFARVRVVLVSSVALVLYTYMYVCMYVL